MTHGRLAAVLAAEVARSRTRKVRVEALRLAAVAADASLEGAPDARRRLLEALRELEAAGAIALPAERGSGWDRTRRPALPIWVRTPPPAPRPALPPEPPRPPELRAVTDLFRSHPPSPAQRALVNAVQMFLRDGRGPFHPARHTGPGSASAWPTPIPVEDRVVVPLAERSLELTGDEKHLDRVRTIRLGAILTPELLRATPVSSPLGPEIVGDGPETLIVENVATFHSLVRHLRGRPGRIGEVVLGGGNRLAGVLRTLAARPDPPTALRYFGDLDPPGVRFPGRADTASLGLPELSPDTDLYSALIRVGTPRPDTERSARAAAAPVEWLPASVREVAVAIFGSRQRLAQEWVGYECLREFW